MHWRHLLRQKQMRNKDIFPPYFHFMRVGFDRGELWFHVDDNVLLKRTQTKQGSHWAVDWLPAIFLDVFFHSWKQTTANFKSSKIAFKLTITIQINLEPSHTLIPFWCTFFIVHWPEQNSRSDKYSFTPRHSSVCWDGRMYLQLLNLLHFGGGGYLFISAGVVLWLSTIAAGFRKRFVTLSGFAA